MTRFERSRRAPRRLRVEGANQTATDIAAHAANTLVFVVDRNIYGHKTVKTALSRMQRNRCAYCETHVKPTHPGNVDHFRPCGAVKQADGAPETTPGYFWLAYRWENLLLACTTCNTSRKRTLFPLRQPNLRAVAPGQDDEPAGPLFVNPAAEDPRAHLRYRQAVAYAFNSSDRGVMIRNVFKLNKNRDLIEDRRQYLAMFKTTVLVAEGHPNAQRQAEAEAVLRRLLGGAGKYYAMICDAFRKMVDDGEIVRLAQLRPV